MSAMVRPRAVRLFAGLLLFGSVLTGLVGESAHGYLVPAATLLVTAALLWTGTLRRLVKTLALLNLVSGFLLVLVLAGGDFLGERKLDVSGVSLLVNLLAGGPLLGLLAPGLLLGLRAGQPMSAWFARGKARQAPSPASPVLVGSA
jgi:hypothetical protein